MDWATRGIVRRARQAAGLVALLVLAGHVPAEAVGLRVGQTAPDFTVAGLGERSVSLHDFRGGVTAVMFWSSWCSRCKEELTFLERMKAKYPTVRFLAVNCETDQPSAKDIARMRRAIEDWNLTFVTGVDEGLKVWELYQINALPTTMIIDPEGKVLFVQANFVLESPEVIDNALQSAISPTAHLGAIGTAD